MAKSKLKKIIHKLHLWLGLSSGLIVCIMALSGCLLSFEDELDRFFAPEINVPNVYTNTKVGLDSIVKKISKQYPDYTIKQLFLFSDPDKTYLVRAFTETEEERLLAVNPYTGSIQKNVNFNHRFFIIVLHLHRYLLMDGFGEVITGVSSLCFVILLISGFIIWLPKKIKNVKQRLSIKWNASLKRLNWDLHSTPGFYIIPFAFTIVLSGLVWSFDWVENSLYFIFDGKPKPVLTEVINKNHTTTANVSLDRIKEEADSIFNFEGNLRFIFDKPSEAKKIKVYKEETDALIPNKRSKLFFDVENGDILKILPYKDSSIGEKARRMVLPVHTGTLFGWPTQILVFITSLAVVSLFITGFFIWYNKTNAKKKKKTKRNG